MSATATDTSKKPVPLIKLKKEVPNKGAFVYLLVGQYKDETKVFSVHKSQEGAEKERKRIVKANESPLFSMFMQILSYDLKE